MKLIIEIPEDVYNDMVKLVKVDGDIDRLVDVAIVNGTPLTESDDCVNRAELLKALDTWDKFGVDDTGHLFRLDNLSYPHYEPYVHYRDVIKAVKGMPSVQPNREKGEWEILDEEANAYECSKCQDAFMLIDGNPENNNYNFCPNCGADMRGKK